MIGIIGYGFVGKTIGEVAQGANEEIYIVDPLYTENTIDDLIAVDPAFIFVCLPTNSPEDMSYLQETVRHLHENASGITVIKSTILPKYLKEFENHRLMVYNPEFLSRSTRISDFMNPPVQILGTECFDATTRLIRLYNAWGVANTNVQRVSMTEASLIKYAHNTFMAMKVTFMNHLYDIAGQEGADYKNLVDAMKSFSWMGSHHFQVPGPDGSRGFGGPCLPKDTRAWVDEYNSDLLQKVLDKNEIYRKQ